MIKEETFIKRKCTKVSSISNRFYFQTRRVYIINIINKLNRVKY